MPSSDTVAVCNNITLRVTELRNCETCHVTIQQYKSRYNINIYRLTY